VEVFIEGAAEAIYESIADVCRIGERSPECHRADWLPGTEPGAVGSRFRGHNRSGLLARWSRTCEVVRADPGRHFAFRTIPVWDPSRRDSTLWSYRLEPRVGGTRVVHSYQIVRMPLLPFRAVFGLALPHHRDMRPQMRHNLRVLREQIEQQQPA
jgi:hypothetical protein